jgi:hypothetical protein
VISAQNSVTSNGISASKNHRNTRGAFGGPAKLAAKNAFLAESAREAIRIANERRLKRQYARFYATKEGKEFAKKFGKAYRVPHNHGRLTVGSPDVEFHDPVDLPQSCVIDHPIEHIEPKAESSYPEGGINVEDMILIRDTFRQVFRWALDGDGLVGKGLRCNICIARMRPDLSNGLNIDRALARNFDNRFKTESLRLTGLYFSRVIEWLRRGNPISARGERIYLLAYTLWPSLINASTLATLGEMNGKTRQAKDKLANCLRDTFSGIKALAMRNDITRTRCRISQLNNGNHDNENRRTYN